MNIGFYSPATPITALAPQRFERAQAFFASKGHTLVAGRLTGQQDFYRSGSIKERAAELNELIHNDDLDMIISTIGGTNSNSLLPYLDFKYLKNHPKIIVGYSDATAFLLAVRSLAPTCRVLYGPALVASFGEFPPLAEETWDYLEKIICTGKNAAITLNAPELWTDDQKNWETYQAPLTMQKNQWGYTETPKLEGRIVGGNLNTMYGFLASKFFPKITPNSLLFIEDAEKDAATVEKNFAMLKAAGVFEMVKGIILGKHANYDDLGSGRQPIDILLEVLNGNPLPVIYEYDSCHTRPMMTTPIGAYAHFDAEAMTVSFSDF
ncbi:S66 family peptidase [Enterococcus sp. LJL120]